MAPNLQPTTYNLQPRIIFWGTPEFALSSLGALIRNGYNVVAAVTNPDEPVGRKQLFTPPPVKLSAQKYKIPVFQPESLKDPNFKKELPEADLFVVAAYGKIIPKEILEISKFGALNLHPSLLPRWRGPSPIQFTILHGDQEAGVTIIKMDEFVDHGPILAARELANFQLSIINYQKLREELSKLGAELLTETLPKWLRGEITPIPQNDAKTTYSKILKKEDGRIDWQKPAKEIERMIRAFNPWPGTWTLWPSDKKIYRLKIESALATDDEPVEGGPGYTYKSPHLFAGYCTPREGLENSLHPSSKTAGYPRRWGDKSPHRPLLVKTGKGSLIIEELTLGGKKRTASAAFLRGYPNFLGSRLI